MGVFKSSPEHVEAQTPEIGINIARDFFRPISKVATQRLRGILAVALIKVSLGREAERLDLAVEFSEQECFTLAEKKELLDTKAVILGEILAEFPVQGFGLLESGQLLIGNEKAIIALEKVRDDENLITRGQQLTRFKTVKSAGVDPSADSQFRGRKLALVAI